MKEKRSGKCGVTRIAFYAVGIAIAVTYFILLIAGKWIFPADSAFYLGIDIFSGTAGNVWLRSLSYLVFFLTLSFVIRFVLKLIASRLRRGRALVDLLCSFIKYIAAIALIFAVLSAWGVNTTALLAGVGILSLIVGLGAQPLIEDIIAGLFIVFERVFEVGDIIVVDGFRGTVKEEDRSLMNICFVMNDEYAELEKPFLDFATERGMVGIKGHRSVGGFRASCYNAQTVEGVQALVQCMKDFEAAH